MGERGHAERVEARAEHGADVRGVDAEPVDGADRVAQEVALDLRGAVLQRAREEVLARGSGGGA